MRELGVYELYEYFCHTFHNIGTFLLAECPENIDFFIFEEFDGDRISFLHPDTLSALLSNQLIGEDVCRLSLELADRFRSVENTPLWNSISVKNDPQWLEILMLADKIKSLLNI